MNTRNVNASQPEKVPDTTYCVNPSSGFIRTILETSREVPQEKRANFILWAMVLVPVLIALAWVQEREAGR